MTFDLLIVPFCALVIGCCICRVNLMHWSGHRPAWLLAYIGMAYFAADVGFDAFLRRPPDPHDWSALLTFLLYFFLTRERWRSGPPPETKL